jgi:anti-anti-sigma factor
MPQSHHAQRANGSSVDLRHVEAPRALLAPDEFRLEAHGDGATVRVALFGVADLAAADEIDRQLLAMQRRGGVRHVLLDLRRLTFVDSSALRLILVWGAEFHRDDISYTIVPGPPAVRRVFDAAGVLDRLTFLSA